MNQNLSSSSTGTLFVLLLRPTSVVALDLQTGATRTVIANLPSMPDGVQIDASRRLVYWTSMGVWTGHGEAFPDADGSVERCDLDGSNHVILVGGGSIVTPKQLQFDADNGLLYWCDREGMAIFRSRTDGSELTPLLRTGRWPQDAADITRHCVGIAIDKKNKQLYWTQKGPPNGGLGRIFRMSLDMPVGVAPEHRDDVQLLIDHLPEPIDLEIDHENGHLYWTDRGDPAIQGNSLNRAGIAPHGLVAHEVLATGFKEAIGLALDRQGKRILVADMSGEIYAVPMGGGTMAPIHQCDGPVTGIAFLP